VGRTKNFALVAIQLNDEIPVVLRVNEAREIAAALHSEADTVDKMASEQN
jgi:hypothetical protein